MLKEWIDESYRAQAPKKLLKQLGGDGGASAPAKKAKPVAKRTSAGTAKKRAKKRVS
jgi:hypothetical protein